jgi:hypothetical protein
MNLNDNLCIILLTGFNITCELIILNMSNNEVIADSEIKMLVI